MTAIAVARQLGRLGRVGPVTGAEVVVENSLLAGPCRHFGLRFNVAPGLNDAMLTALWYVAIGDRAVSGCARASHVTLWTEVM